MSNGPRIKKIPDHDNRERLICPECDYIEYQNPKMVVGTIIAHHKKVLLCKRAIEPQKGLWTLPAGYMELEETSEEGAVREAYEEAGVDIEITGIVGIFNLPHISQVQLIYKGVMLDDKIEPGPESLEAKFFAWDEIPWKELAFPTVEMALQYWHSNKEHDDQDLPPIRAISNIGVEDGL